MKIIKVTGREIYDSRGWPTILCEVWLDDGSIFSGYAPTGLSVSTYEAHELRDNDARLWGKGVTIAVSRINELIAPCLIGKEPIATRLDETIIELDGTPDKSHLGANTMIATSMALYRAFAHSEEMELFELFAHLMDTQTVSLPVPLFNLINGGRHAENILRFQEFMIAPLGASSLREGIDVSIMIFNEIKHLLRKQGMFFGIGDEGGITAPFEDPQQPLDIMMEAMDKVALDALSSICSIALDVAASQFYDSVRKRYVVNDATLSATELVAYYAELAQKYPLYSIEDGLAEDDWEGWRAMYQELSDSVQIVADDIFATNPARLITILEHQCATAVIIKPNQIGTITESLEIMKMCNENNLNTIVSHRSGETEDSFLADFAVGTSAGQLKAGGLCRSERIAKYNRLLEIEEILRGNGSRYDE